MKVCFETFGCRLNRAEALKMEAAFLARGWVRTERHDDADMIVVRGCSVTHRAQRDCEKLVEHIREKYPLKRVVVTGCMKERRNEQWLRDVSGDAGTPVPTRTARAYLKVQDGCGASCAFCIVPQFRGKSRSVPFQEVLDEARRFVEAGYREIVVTGCNLSQYADGGRTVADLVDELAELSQDCRIRLGSLEPTPVAREAVAAMSSHANICRSLHIPVQSGSDRILSAMKRPYRRKDIDLLVAEAEKLMPHLGLGCDIMTGFPDERETDFMATQALLRRLPFTKIHVFPFSERPGTLAASLPNPVPGEVRHERARAVARQAEKERLKYIARFKGRRVRVVVEDLATLGGWTSEYVWCRTDEGRAKFFSRPEASGGRGLKRGDAVDMVVREVQGHMLVGDPC